MTNEINKLALKWLTESQILPENIAELILEEDFDGAKKAIREFISDMSVDLSTAEKNLKATEVAANVIIIASKLFVDIAKE